VITTTKRYVTSSGRRRREGFTARLGPLTANGSTKREAEINLLDRVRAALLHVERGPRYGTFRGVSYAIAPNIDETWSVWRTGYRPDYTVSGSSSEHTALRDVYLDILQQQWTKDVEDDIAYVDSEVPTLPIELSQFKQARGEFLSWTRWQRGYTQLRAEGLDDNAARNRLMGYA
jgi:hypothetical protein